MLGRRSSFNPLKNTILTSLLALSSSLRRNYIYEDAFDKLSPDNEANLRLKMRVQLVNAAGVNCEH